MSAAKKIDPKRSDVLRRVAFKRPTKSVTAYGTTKWTLASVRSAVSSHIRGELKRSASLSLSVRTDSTIASAVEKRVSAVIRSELSLEGDNEEINELTADVLWEILPEVELERLLTDLLMLGYFLGELVWDTSSYPWKPRLTWLDPQHLRYDVSTCKWFYNHDCGEEEVAPGDGRWVLISRWEPGTTAGLICQLAETWIYKKLNVQDWVDFNDGAAQPIVVLNLNADNMDDEGRTAIAGQVADARELKSLVLNKDETATPLQLENQSASSFEALIDMFDRKIQVSVIGSNLSTEMSSGGSYAAAQVHRGVEADKVKADVELLSTELREQVFKPFTIVNFGDEAIDTTPWPQWNIQVDPDPTAVAQSLSALVDLVTKLEASKHEIANITDIAKRVFNVDLKRKVIV